MKEKMTHFMTSVKVGPKGQIVIPKEIREMFDIDPGDSLLMMADSQRGIALNKEEVMVKIAEAIFEGKGPEVYPGENPEHLPVFADAIKETGEKGSAKR